MPKIQQIKKKFQHWSRSKWQAIDETGLLKIPRRLIEWGRSNKNYVWNPALWGSALEGVRSYKISHFYMLLGIPGIVTVEAYTLWGLPVATGIFLTSFYSIFINVYVGFMEKPILSNPPWILRPVKKITQDYLNNLFGAILVIGGLFVPAVILPFLTIFTALEVYGLFAGMILFLLTAPMNFIGIWAALNAIDSVYKWFRKNAETDWGRDFAFPLSLSLGLSFSLTFLALLIGKVTVPEAWIPKNFQMLTANVLLDGLTMVVTLIILEKGLNSVRWYSIPTAIAIDILFSCNFLHALQLYLGLVFTDHALSVIETVRVLFGLSPNGNTWELGPYFWVMHTTFLPTIFYLGLIFVAFLGKGLLSVVHGFLGMAQANEEPLKLTGTLCGLIAGFFLFLTYVIPNGKLEFRVFVMYGRSEERKGSWSNRALRRFM